MTTSTLPVSEASPHSISVLVVDDDPVVHDVLSSTLGKEGYRLMHARDGHQALEIMRKTPPDIVTLDVMMPKVDGWSVLGIMKSDPALEHIPVIMLTIVDDRNIGFSLGASEFMTKPIDRNQLIGLLRKFAPSGEGTVVLIVDDDPDVRGVVKSAIEGAGLKTAEVDNGRVALDWLKQQPDAGAGAARSDDAGGRRLRVSRAHPGRRDARRAADRRADRQGSDRRRAELPRRADDPGAEQERAADHHARQGAVRHCQPRPYLLKLNRPCTEAGAMKILLVEDNEMNRDMLSRRLIRNGFEVVIAVDGQEGVDLAASAQPDLILMDISLPVIDGWEATRRVKANPATAKIPVIALTAHAMAQDKEKALAAGCDDFDTKPVELPRLLEKINALLNKK